ncbi:hypothetical protein CDES_06250 [Corynebacterium deserti GIMN1.010]|uniref:Uncharacterized protein n=1 Tax=Corynebacterium deserti GIMN1.010 TaxID=931089 RepID=A0A0M4CDN3_9CORY|nr:hypothetical protein [Corynebacterium deserti]ALC05678.1 hypothetical protein CDES_06250 [Corynebacterium deserti GIMN1.010]
MIFPDPPVGRLAEVIDVAWRLVAAHGWNKVSTREEIAARIATRAFAELGPRLHDHMAREYLHIHRLLTGAEFPRDLLPDGLETWAGTPFYEVTGHAPLKVRRCGRSRMGRRF